MTLVPVLKPRKCILTYPFSADWSTVSLSSATTSAPHSEVAWRAHRHRSRALKLVKAGLSRITNAQIYRSGLLAFLAERLYGSGAGNGRFSAEKALYCMTSPKSNAEAVSRDAYALLTLAGETHDVRVAQEGRKRYCIATKLLQRRLMHGTCSDEEFVLAATLLRCRCVDTSRLILLHGTYLLRRYPLSSAQGTTSSRVGLSKLFAVSYGDIVF